MGAGGTGIEDAGVAQFQVADELRCSGCCRSPLACRRPVQTSKPTLTAVERTSHKDYATLVYKGGPGDRLVVLTTSLVHQERLKGWEQGSGRLQTQTAVACVLIGPAGPIHRLKPRYHAMTAGAPFTSEYRAYEPLKPRSRSRYSRTKSWICSYAFQLA